MQIFQVSTEIHNTIVIPIFVLNAKYLADSTKTMNALGM